MRVMQVFTEGEPMEFEQLRQLDAIDREGTMSGASKALHISQPALSRSMQRLETELGQALFERVGRRAALNAAGRLALEHARRILRDEQAMLDALADHARQARALRVATVAPAPLWRLTALLIERFPQTVLTSQSLDEQAVERAVLDGTTDLGIALKPCQLPVVRSFRLMTERLYVSLPAEHPLAAEQSLDAAQLDGETFLLYQGIGFWMNFCAQGFPHSEFIVQEDRNVFGQMLPTTPLLYFVSDAPAQFIEAPGRSVVPLRDAAAGATYYLLMREDARGDAQAAYTWARTHAEK